MAQEIAFYYPGHVWNNPDWIKSLLLFFDGVGLLIPEYKRDEPEERDPSLVIPLRERGLLHYMVADEVVDKESTEQLSKALGDLLASGALDRLRKQSIAFKSLSKSRMGFFGEHELADDLLQKLKERGLAEDSRDGVSIPMHPMVRALILTLLSQILRSKGKVMNAELVPATDQAPVIQALTDLLNVRTAPSAGRVVEFDLQYVGADLSRVPLDEVLAFRNEHLVAHRRYVQSARSFAIELSLMSDAERQIAFAARQKELDDQASDIRRQSRAAWRKSASFALTLAGAAWMAVEGNPVDALFAAVVAGLAGIDFPENRSAFTYLFAASSELTY